MLPELGLSLLLVYLSTVTFVVDGRTFLTDPVDVARNLSA